MAHLIDKDILVAEIERYKKEEGWCQVGKDTADVYYARGFRFACERIISFIDTQKLKEVDLEKEIEEHVINMPMSEFTHDSEVDGFWEWARKEFKHFFELGLEANQEPVSDDLEGEISRCIIDEDMNFENCARHFANWQKQQMMAKAVDVTIAIPCQNLDVSYTQLVDSKEALPFGDKLKVLVIKEGRI